MIIVTGASGGLGKKVVDQLKEIDSILAIYNSSPPLMQSEENVRYIKADLSNLDGVEGVVNELKGHQYENSQFTYKVYINGLVAACENKHKCISDILQHWQV